MDALEILAKICIDNGAQQIKSELTQLFEIVATMENRKTALEIGSYQGGCLHGYKEIFQKVISIDIEKRSNIDGVIYIEKASTESAKELRAALGNSNAKIDFCMIDAGHTYDEVKDDFEFILPFMKKGGIVAFHDIVDSAEHRQQNCFVAEFWNELKNEHQELATEFKELKSGNNWGGIGVMFLR